VSYVVPGERGTTTGTAAALASMCRVEVGAVDVAAEAVE
jgi:hypothetical protein